MIRFENVTKIYPANSQNANPTTVLHDVSFEIKASEFVSIVGKSGAGKTTLVRLILGLETPTYGSVFFEGKNMNELNDQELQELRRRIGGIHQDYKLLPKKTVYENVAYILAMEGRNEEDISNDVPKILEIIGLSEKLDSFPRELSGGEQQRLAVARALVNYPDVIIADEPTGNLDPYNTYEVILLLEKINKAGRTVILATHDREIVNKLGRRVITIESGKIIRDEEKGRFII